MLPAHAGMIPQACTYYKLLTGAPRACGDDPWMPLLLTHV